MTPPNNSPGQNFEGPDAFAFGFAFGFALAFFLIVATYAKRTGTSSAEVGGEPLKTDRWGIPPGTVY
jgi:hypothetical protein